MSDMGLVKGKKGKTKKKSKRGRESDEQTEASPRGVDEMGAAEASLLNEALESFRSPEKSPKASDESPALEAVQEDEADGSSAQDKITAFRESARPLQRCKCCTFWHFGWESNWLRASCSLSPP